MSRIVRCSKPPKVGDVIEWPLAFEGGRKVVSCRRGLTSTDKTFFKVTGAVEENLQYEYFWDAANGMRRLVEVDDEVPDA